MAHTDVGIIAGIVIIFMMIGTALPYINDSLSDAYPTNSTSNNYNSIYEAENPSNLNVATGTISMFSIVVSVFSMFFWTFGALPMWLDLFFVFLRLMLALLVYRLIRSGSG